MGVPRIAYFSWPATETTGGIKLVFRHVEILNRYGITAVVVLDDATSPGWLETSAPVIDRNSVQKHGDILVFPENHAELFRSYADWPNQKIVYCQNQFMFCCGLAGKRLGDFGITGVLALGRAAAEFCSARFPEVANFSVPVGIDPSYFFFEKSKKLQIAFAPRKRQLEAVFIRDWFYASSPEWRTVPWVEIRDMSETQVARTLRESAVYLSLQRLESVGMSAIEAMACGCVVAGFAGQGGNEYATSANGFWAPDDDCIRCTAQLANAVHHVSNGGQRLADMIQSASITAETYNMDRLEKRLVSYWTDFLSKQ